MFAHLIFLNLVPWGRNFKRPTKCFDHFNFLFWEKDEVL